MEDHNIIAYWFSLNQKSYLLAHILNKNNYFLLLIFQEWLYTA